MSQSVLLHRRTVVTTVSYNCLYVHMSIWSNDWNTWGFRPPLCSYRLNWARRTSWGWWDELDDTALQTQDSKFEPWRPEAEQTTTWSCRLPTILNRYELVEKKYFASLKLEGQSGFRTRDPWLSKPFQAASLTTAPGPPPTPHHAQLNITPSLYVHLRFVTRLASQQTRSVGPMLGWWWPPVYDAGTALAQHWANASCLLG